jgi:hypothetical protein
MQDPDVVSKSALLLCCYSLLLLQPFVTSELKKKGSKKGSKMASYSEAGEKRSGLFGFVKALVLFGAVTVGSIFATAAIPEDNDITVNARKVHQAPCQPRADLLTVHTFLNFLVIPIPRYTWDPPPFGVHLRHYLPRIDLSA